LSADLTSFVRLSTALAGEKALPVHLAKAYFDRASAQLKDKLSVLLARFDDLVKGGKDPVIALRENILPDRELGHAANVVLLLWYIGGTQNAAGDWEVGLFFSSPCPRSDR
jgi:hypothetical protein